MGNLDFVPWCLLGKSPLGDKCPAPAKKQAQLLHCSHSVPSHGCCTESLVLSLALPLPAQPGPGELCRFSFPPCLPQPCFSTIILILLLSLDIALTLLLLIFFPLLFLYLTPIFPPLFVLHHSLIAHSAPCSAS